MKTFGQRLREVRESRGYNAKAFAPEVKVSLSSLSQYENDISYPSMSKLAFIFKKLDITPEEFFKGVELL